MFRDGQVWFLNGPVWARLQRTAITAVLLALMVWALRARPLALTSPPPELSLAWVFILVALGAAVASVLYGLAVRDPRRRRRDREPVHIMAIPFTRWERLRALAAVLVVFLTLTFVLWAALHLLGGGTGSVRVGPTPTPSVITTGPRATGPSAPVWFPGVLVVLCLIGTAALILGSVLRRRAHADLSASPAPVGSPTPVSAQAELPASSRTPAGRDARGDVVAAFRAFEEDAARLGVPVDPPETAVDIAEHPVTRQAADPRTLADLTALFHRARYSSETITVADQDRAQVLLTQIRAQLGRLS